MNYKDKTWMYQKYVVENVSGPEIAKLCGISSRTAAYWIDKFGLQKLYHNAEWLREQYESKGLSTIEIAKLCNADASTITCNLAKFGIKARSISESNSNRWKDELYKNKMLAKFRSDEHRNKLKTIWENDEYALKQSETHIAISTPERRAANSASQKRVWADPEYRTRMAEIFKSATWRKHNAEARAAAPKVSSIQRILYSILDDLGVKYYREYEDKADPQCLIGPWNFDCVVPREGKPSLLIECQGEYFHGTPAASARDKAKATYISSIPGYELKCIWEHEFSNHNKVVELLKYWLGLSSIDMVDFSFDDIEIRECPASEYRLLLSKYHYLSNAGRGGIACGAYLGDELAAVCVFSPLARQNIHVDGYQIAQIRELSRLCIHPKYQKPNFASWFVSRCIKSLNHRYKCIISYCDTTFGHDGAVYKACNFVQDGETTPDYWYANKDGWKIHKKTLYNHAVKMGMKEAEYAEANGYNKVFGREKLRFVYKR